MNINISAGRSCFTKCEGCYNHWGKSKNPVRTKTIISFITFLSKRLKIKKITYCGGDPLSRPDILELLKLTKSLGLFTQLDTVGTALLGKQTETIFFGKNIIEPLDPSSLAIYIDQIGIPLDGTTNEQIKLFRSGREQILEETLEILKLLNNLNLKICINTVVHSQNIDHLSKIFDLVEENKSIKKWQFFQYQPTGPLGYRNKNKFLISNKTFAQFKNDIQINVRKYPFEIEFKSNLERKMQYLLIDTDGLAWIPKTHLSDEEQSCERLIIGDINNESDFPHIIRFLKKGKLGPLT